MQKPGWMPVRNTAVAAVVTLSCPLDPHTGPTISLLDAGAMAFSAGRRSLSHHLLARRLHPSLSHLVPSSHNDRRQGQDPSSPSAPPNPTQRHPTFPFPSGDLRWRSRSQHLTLPVPLPFGAHLAAHRNFSSTSSPGAETDVFMPSVAAAAAADWFPPVAALQHALEAVHSLTGLNWWVSIVLTTVLLRTSMIFVPRLVKSTMKNYNSMDPRPQVGKMISSELFTKCGRYVQPSIFMSFLFSIVNMVEKVPSLKEGGACWFTDLTTPDELYILPVLATMTLLATTEIIMREGMVENHVPQTLKFSRVLMAMILPFSSFPKAVYLFLITWELFSLGHFLALLRRIRHLTRVAARPTPTPTYHLSVAPEAMPAAAAAAARGSEHEQSGCEASVERKRRTPRVITNRVQGDSTSSDGR